MSSEGMFLPTNPVQRTAFHAAAEPGAPERLTGRLVAPGPPSRPPGAVRLATPHTHRRCRRVSEDSPAGLPRAALARWASRFPRYQVDLPICDMGRGGRGTPQGNLLLNRERHTRGGGLSSWISLP